MAIRLGEIFIQLGLSTASFTKGLNDAKKLAFGNEKEIERSIKIVGTAVAGMATAAATGLFFLSKRAIDNADQMGKLSQRFGIALEMLSGLGHAAKMEGVELEGLAKGLQHLSQFMVANGEGSKDLKEKFFELAEQFSMSKDGAEKAAAAQRIFGKAGAELIPLLNQGRAGIEAAWKEAEKLGLIFDSKTTAAADRFNDNLDRLKAISIGLANSLIAELLPTLDVLSRKLVDAGLDGKALGTSLGSFLGKQVRLTAIDFQNLTTNIDILEQHWKILTATMPGQIPAARAELTRLKAVLTDLARQSAIVRGEIE